MEKVTNMELMPECDTQAKIKVTIEKDGIEDKLDLDITDKKLLDYINDCKQYLQEQYMEKENNRTDSWKQKNMKSSLYYAIGVVGVFGIFLSSSETLIPFFIAAIIISFLAIVIINIGFLKPFEKTKEALEIKTRLNNLSNIELKLAENNETSFSNFNESFLENANKFIEPKDEASKEKVIQDTNLKEEMFQQVNWERRRKKLKGFLER